MTVASPDSKPSRPGSRESELRVGMVLAASSTAPDMSEGFQPIVRARLRSFSAGLGAAVGVHAVPVDYADYPSLLEAMYEGELDVAWLPPIVAMRAASAGRALPIALPVRRGVSTFHTALFADHGTPFQRASDLFGARAAWVDPQSASGYLVIRAALRAQGLELERAFAEQSFLGSHQAVVRAVLEGRADVGATFLHHDASGSGVWRAGWGNARVHVVARMGPIPSDVIAAGVHVPVRLIRSVQTVLTAGANAELAAGAAQLMEAERFIAATSEHLKPLEDLLDFLEDAVHPWRSIIPPPSARPPT